MQLRISPPKPRYLRAIGVLLAAALLAVLLWRPLVQTAGLVLGAAVICFFAAPLAAVFERRLSRPLAALACLAVLGGTTGLVLWLLVPRMLSEAVDLTRTLPGTLRQLTRWVEGARGWLEARLPGVALPRPDLTALEGLLTGIAGGTVSFAVNLADILGRASMMVVLAYFFLCDRDRILLRLELLLPRSFRCTAVRMGNAIIRELRLYLQGQLMIAGAVGILSAAALMLVGVRSALALGPLIGLLNMIPYFGPYIGGAPAVLIALSDGWQKALMTVLALAVVQQLDGAWISPHIMGSVTGFSPALVLVAIYAGARVGGIGGMLLALPVLLTIRTAFRIFVQKYENI